MKLFDSLPDWLKNLLILIAVIAGLGALWAVVKVLIDILFVLAIGVGIVGGGYLLAKKFNLL